MAQDQLRQAIELAQNGQRDEARTLLRRVLAQDKNNEAAWMWLASVAESQSERIASLQHVLHLNPQNEKARSALAQLGQSASQAGHQADGARELRRMSMKRQIQIVAGMLVVCFILSMISRSLTAGGFNVPTAMPYDMPISSATLNVTATPSALPSVTDGPSPTPIVLPATWTPEPSKTLVPTRTVAPTGTPPPTRTKESFLEVTPTP